MSVSVATENEHLLLSAKGKSIEYVPAHVIHAFDVMEGYCASHDLTWHLECQRCRTPVLPRNDKGTDVFVCACRERRAKFEL